MRMATLPRRVYLVCAVVANPQVIWIHTRWVIACVADVRARWNFPANEFQHKPMRFEILVVFSKEAVTVPVFARSP